MGDLKPTPPSLPKDAPKDLRDFVECKTDNVELHLDKISWIPAPKFVPDAAKPSASATAGDGPGKATISVGWGFVSLSLPVDVNDGQLNIDTSGLPDLASDLKDGIDNWVKKFNDTLKANKKRIGGLTIAGFNVTLTKALLMAAPPGQTTAPPTPPPTSPPKPSLPPLPPPKVDPPKPEPPKTTPQAPQTPPTDGNGDASKKGCLIGILAVAALALGTGAYLLFRDSSGDHKSAPPASAAPTAAPTTLASPTTLLPTTLLPTTLLPTTTTQAATTTTEAATTTTSTEPSNVCLPLKGQPVSWQVAGALDGCTWSGPLTECGTVFFPCPPVDEIPGFLTFYPSVGIIHQPGPPDPLTGVSGPSQADFLINFLFPSPGLFQVQSNCGGTTLTGQGQFNPGGGVVTVIQPLLQFGGCDVSSVQFISGNTIFSFNPSIFGTNGHYDVTATPVPVDPNQVPPLPAIALPSLRDAIQLQNAIADPLAFDCVDEYFNAPWYVNTCPAGASPVLLHYFPPSGLLTTGIVTNGLGQMLVGDLSQLSKYSTVWMFGDALFPCGQGVLAITVCPKGSTTLDVPSYVLIGLTADNLGQASAMQADFSAAGGPTIDATNSGGTWSLSTSGPGAGDARLIIRNDTAIFAIPDTQSPTLRNYSVKVTIGGQDMTVPATAVDSVLELPQLAKPGATPPPTAATETRKTSSPN